MAQYVYIVTRRNDSYDTDEELLVFGSEKKARDYIDYIMQIAKRNGLLEDYRNDRALAYVQYRDPENGILLYTDSLDILAKKVL